MAHTITSAVCSGLDAAVLELRRTAFRYKPTDDVTDEFDRQSTHVVLLAGEKLAGAARLTPHPPSVLYVWTNGALDFTSFAHAADMSRAAIAEEFRGQKLYDLLMSETVLEANRQGYQHLFGVLAMDHRYLEAFWKRLGAEMMGEAKLCAPRNCPAQFGLPLHVPVRASLSRARKIISEHPVFRARRERKSGRLELSPVGRVA